MTCGRIITPADYDDVVVPDPWRKAMNEYAYQISVMNLPDPPQRLPDGSVILRVKGQRPVRYVKE